MTNLIPLNDNTKIPQIGYGTFLVGNDEAATLVQTALEVGYRHIDTAQMYGNESGVGAGLRASGIPREQVYLTSKLDNTNHHRDDVLRSYDQSIARLGVDKLDLFLIHWPMPTRDDLDLVETWKAMVELVETGRLTSAGVSNFQPAHLEQIVEATGFVPAVNQIEIHPHFHNDEVRTACDILGTAIQAWSPLGRGRELTDPVVNEVAAQTGDSAAQVILKWHLMRGDIVLPKSSSGERMVENLAGANIQLSAEQFSLLDGLDQGASGRFGFDPDTFDGTIPARRP